MENILEVKNLQISFNTSHGRLQAVRNISFSLRSGEILVLVGESGSGKSVTSRAIMRILSSNAKIDSGNIFYRDTDLLTLSERKMCKIRGSKIAMIFQDPLSSLDPIVRVGKQITETIIHNTHCSAGEAKRQAISLLGEVGIPSPSEAFYKYPLEFSGGQRQRIVIAIALSSRPELLICDEPTTALDVTVQSQILDLILRLRDEHGLSVIFITHDLGVVARVADRIAVMYAGKIVEYGLCDEIFYDPRHPYTWALLTSTPDLEITEPPEHIAGSLPDMTNPPVGDAFAERNKYALKIDFEAEPPMTKITDTHSAATWLLHPSAPHIPLPAPIRDRIERAHRKKKENIGNE